MKRFARAGFGWLATIISSPALGNPLWLPDRSCLEERASKQHEREAEVRCGSLEHISRLLRSESEADRILGYRRLRARRDGAAWQSFAKLLSDPRRDRTSAEELLLARAIAPLAADPEMVALVSRLAIQASHRSEPREPQRELAVRTLLLSLAWSRQALPEFAQLLSYDGLLADASIDALLVYPPILERLLDFTFKRSPGWAHLLGRLGQTRAILALHQALVDGSPTIQAAAAEALLELGDPAILVLIERWRGDPKTPAELANVTHPLVRSRTVSCEDARQSARCTSLSSGGELDDASTSTLLELAQGDDACAAAAEALARRDGPTTRPVLRDLLQASPPWIRTAIARGLSSSLDPTATGLLVARLELEPDPCVRRALVRSLQARPSTLADSLLSESARFDPDPGVRAMAARAPAAR